MRRLCLPGLSDVEGRKGTSDVRWKVLLAVTSRDLDFVTGSIGTRSGVIGREAREPVGVRMHVDTHPVHKHLHISYHFLDHFHMCELSVTTLIHSG